MRWVSEDPTEDRVNEFCELFSRMALQGVIDSPWGARREGLPYSDGRHDGYDRTSSNEGALRTRAKQKHKAIEWNSPVLLHSGYPEEYWHI